MRFNEGGFLDINLSLFTIHHSWSELHEQTLVDHQRWQPWHLPATALPLKAPSKCKSESETQIRPEFDLVCPNHRLR